MKVIEGTILCAGFFLMASDSVPVVLAGIGLLALAGFLGEVCKDGDLYKRRLPGPTVEEYQEQEERRHA